MFCNTNSVVLILLLSVWSALHRITNSTPTSTFGRSFYVGTLKAYTDSDFYLLLTSNATGIATIHIPHLHVNTTQRFNQSLEYRVSQDLVTSLNATLENKGIHVSADVDVTLFVIRIYKYTCEGFLVLPSAMLSTRYIISSYYDDPRYKYYSEFLILSVHDNNTIRVNGKTIPVSMDFLDTYLHRSRVDFSGTVVESNKPVAVFSGHEAANVPKNCGIGEYIVEQLLPTSHFSRTFIVPPVPPKSGYVTRVYSSERHTTLTFSDSMNYTTITLSEIGQFNEMLSNDEPLLVEADKPIQVMLYGTCYSYNSGDIGDTFMSIVPSIQQYASSYRFTVSSSYTYFKHYLVILSKTDYVPGLRLNGQQMGQLFRTYPLQYEKNNFTVNVYYVTVGVYHLQHVYGKQFGALQYGYYSRQAYGYVLGLNITKDCHMGNDPDNGHVLINNSTFPITATFDCNTGFEMNGSATITCQTDGIWDKVPPTCLIKDCGSLASPANGNIDVSNGTEFGSQVIYGCMLGYNLNGGQKRTCLADGKWNGSQPDCLPTDCGSLASPANGNIDVSNGTVFGSQVLYSCMPGYTLNGGQKRTCLADGNWNGSQSDCLPADVGGFTCLNCKDMSHLYLCDTLTRCSHGQVCYVETLTANDGQVKYSSGCMDSEKCSQNKRETNKRSSECVHCCSSQLCNLNGCGSESLPSPDLRGPLCYDCAYVSNMDECKTMKLCTQDEVCSIEKYDWGGLYDHYTAKCHSSQCISHKRSYNRYTTPRHTVRSTPVCQNCCTSDLCNVGCNKTSQSGTGVAIVG